MLAQIEPFSHGKWLKSVQALVGQLFNYTLSGIPGRLILLGFAASPYGKLLFQHRMLASAYRPDLSLKEVSSTLIPNIGRQEQINLLDMFVPFQKAIHRQNVCSSSSSSSSPPESGSDHVSVCTALSEESISSSSSSSQTNIGCPPFRQPILPNQLLFKKREDETVSSSGRTPEVSSDFRSFLLGLPTPLPSLNVSAIQRSDLSVNDVETALKNNPNVNHSRPTQSLSQASFPQLVTPKKEMSKMSVEELLSILNSSSDAKQYSSQQPDDVDMDDYGRLAAEEKEKYDEYVEKKKQAPSAFIRTQPRRRCTQGTSTDTAIEIDDESSDNIDLDKDTEVATEESGPTLPSVQDPISWVMEQIDTIVSIDVRMLFRDHISMILAPQFHPWIPPLCEMFHKDLSLEQPTSHIDDISGRILFLTRDKDLAAIYSQVLHGLTYSLCSESSCERVFSKLGDICGKTKQHMLIQTINHRLFIQEARRSLLE